MSKKIKKKVVPKFALGTTIENPADALYKNQMNLAGAQMEGANNGWVQGLKIGGNLAQMVGQGMMQQGLAAGQGADGKGVAGFLNKNSGAVNSGMNTANAIGNFFAMGGEVPGNIPVEVEGGEAGEMPNGQMVDFNGPTHEEGGIPTSLPVGTEMYSNRIKVDGVTIADKVKRGAKKEMRLEDLLSKAKGDSLLTNALNRTKTVNETEKANFQKIQDTVKQAMEGPSEVHAWGNTVGGGNPNWVTKTKGVTNLMDALNNDPDGNLFTNDSVAPNNLGPIEYKDNNFMGADMVDNTQYKSPSANNPTEGIPGAGLTLGDAVGMAGNIYSTFAPMNNTLKNRAGDTPNINAYKDYGKDGLNTIDQAGQYLDMVKAQKQKDLQLSRNSTMKSIDNSTRSLNVNRAMKLAADASVNNTSEQISNNFAEQMFGMANTKAGMQNQKDQVVMAGNQAKDLADREDRDNFFSQMGTDIATKGQGIQEMSYDLNKMKEGKEMTNLVNQLSKYGYKYNPKTGKMYMDESFKSKTV